MSLNGREGMLGIADQHESRRNGSEFINHTVADLLDKLLIEQTKSRPRRSNDNGLVETKNSSVVRKHMGFGHVACEHADKINAFYEEQFNPCLNFHRPAACRN